MDTSDTPDEFSLAEETGVWEYVDEDGETVTVVDDDCEHEEGES